MKRNSIDFFSVCGPPQFAIYFKAPDEVLVNRIVERGKVSGRADDTLEAAQRRIQIFHETMGPCIEHLKENKIPIHEIDATKDLEINTKILLGILSNPKKMGERS